MKNASKRCAVASMMFVAIPGCDSEPDHRPAGGEVQELDSPWLLSPQGEALESDSQEVSLTVFEDDIGSAGQDETVKVITSLNGYQQLFGNSPPADLHFNQEWVLFYSAGVQPTGGFEASIEELLYVPAWRLLHAEAKLREPGPQCFVTPVLTVPHVLARFPIPSPVPRYLSSDIETEIVDCNEPEEPVVLSFDFNQGAQEWSSHFADLPPDFNPTIYELSAGIAALPSEIGPGTGFLVGGTNRSDDLWMGLERRVGTEAGIEPDRSYHVAYEIQFGSNAPTGCFGAGGAPGESVYLKAGAASVDPEPISVPNDDFLRLNIDKGNQAQGGINASVVSHIANGIPCDEGDGPYVSLHRTHEHPQVVTADAAGNLWLIVGTDSAFESRTELYYQSITVTLTPQ